MSGKVKKIKKEGYRRKTIKISSMSSKMTKTCDSTQSSTKTKKNMNKPAKEQKKHNSIKQKKWGNVSNVFVNTVNIYITMAKKKKKKHDDDDQMHPSAKPLSSRHHKRSWKCPQ